MALKDGGTVVTDVGVSKAKLFGIFTLALIGAWLVLIAFTLFMDSVFEIELKNSAVGAVLIMSAAMPAGGSYYRHASAMPTKGFGCMMGAGFGLIAAVMSVGVLLCLSLSGLLPEIAGMEKETGLLVFVLILSFILFWPVAWVGFYLGARAARQKAEKLAAKA